ncbi:MAG: hypothetical protein ACK53T_00155 [Planctomycetota bacterium]
MVTVLAFAPFAYANVWYWATLVWVFAAMVADLLREKWYALACGWREQAEAWRVQSGRWREHAAGWRALYEDVARDLDKVTQDTPSRS